MWIIRGRSRQIQTPGPVCLSLLALVFSLAACTQESENPSSPTAFTGASSEARFHGYPVSGQRDYDVEGGDDTQSEDPTSRAPNLEVLLIEGLSGPSSPTSETVASFDFGCSKDDCRFTCVVTGAAIGVVKSKTPCEPGVTYSGLKDDSYTFTVVARDNEGNESEPSSWDWAVDTILPGIEITAAPPEETSERWALLEFECTKSDCQLECALDWEDSAGSLRRGSFESCVSPHLIDDLEPGHHLLRLRATDTMQREGFAEQAVARDDRVTGFGLLHGVLVEATVSGFVGRFDLVAGRVDVVKQAPHFVRHFAELIGVLHLGKRTAEQVIGGDD